MKHFFSSLPLLGLLEAQKKKNAGKKNGKWKKKNTHTQHTTQHKKKRWNASALTPKLKRSRKSRRYRGLWMNWAGTSITFIVKKKKNREKKKKTGKKKKNQKTGGTKKKQ